MFTHGATIGRPSVLEVSSLTRRDLAGVTVCIVVFGHVTILAYAGVVLLAQLGRLCALDVIQIALVGSPMLAVAAYSGVNYLFVSQSRVQGQTNAATSAIVITVGVPLLLTLALLVTYSVAFFFYVNITWVGIVLGVIETSLGAYMGVIRDRLFLTKEDG